MTSYIRFDILSIKYEIGGNGSASFEVLGYLCYSCNCKCKEIHKTLVTQDFFLCKSNGISVVLINEIEKYFKENWEEYIDIKK